MNEQIRGWIHTTPFEPFYIHTASSKSVYVHHPDFIFAPPTGRPEVIVEEPNGTRHLLNVMLITSLDKAPPPQQAAA